MKAKLKSQKGFTLVEMMACTITLVLVAGICTSGIQLALRAYNESVYESNSQMLESTLNMYMSDILRYSFDIYTTGSPDAEGLCNLTGFSNTAYQMTTGTMELGITEETKGKIVIFDHEATNPNRKEVMIASKNIYAANLYITDFVLKYNRDTKCFVGTYKIKSEILQDAERVCTFSCRSVLARN